MYVGVQVDPFAYTYNMTTYKPQEGLGNLSADSHNFSVLAAPTIKIGFKFWFVPSQLREVKCCLISLIPGSERVVGDFAVYSFLATV